MAVLRFNLDAWAKYHNTLPDRIRLAALRGARSAGLRAVAIAIRRTREAKPANPDGIGEGGAVNTGEFLRAWRSSSLPDGARVSNDRPYAPVIDGGRREGAKAPPRDVIMHWAMRRLGLTEKEARQAAFPIQQAIKRRGLVARQILSSEDGQAELAKILDEEVAHEIHAELAKPQ